MLSLYGGKRMRIVLSRKGFDTTNSKQANRGGAASPIFPDGTMFSLPIPEVQSYIQTGTRYSALICPIEGFRNMGEIVAQLSKGELRPAEHSLAHVDPDLDRNCLQERPENWMPLFGQDGGAQTELCDIEVGDLFLFFGRFRDVTVSDSDNARGKVIAPRRGSVAMHVIFGWLSVGKILKVGSPKANEWLEENPWAAYHSHFNGHHKNNTVYVAADQCFDVFPGAGVFRHYDERLRLSALDCSSTVWRLPPWMRPTAGHLPLTHHQKAERWDVRENCVILSAARRGQEFILNTTHYPEADEWAESLLSLTSQ